VLNLAAERVLYRDQLTKWSFNSGLTLKRIRNYIEGEAIDTSSHDFSILNLGTDVSRFVNDTLLSFTASYNAGLRAFGAYDDAANLPADAPSAQYKSWQYGISANKPFVLLNQRFSWQSDFRGQFSRDTLYGTEEFSIGSLYNVRGFRETSFSGHRGNYLRNTLGMPIGIDIAALPAQLQPYIGYDIGHIHQQRTISGWTAGCDFAVGPVSTQIAYSHPASSPDDPDEDGWIYASFTVIF